MDWYFCGARMEIIQIGLWYYVYFYLGSVDVLFIECFDPECGGWSVFFCPTSSPVVGPTGLSKRQHVCLSVCLSDAWLYIFVVCVFI